MKRPRGEVKKLKTGEDGGVLRSCFHSCSLAGTSIPRLLSGMRNAINAANAVVFTVREGLGPRY